MPTISRSLPRARAEREAPDPPEAVDADRASPCAHLLRVCCERAEAGAAPCLRSGFDRGALPRARRGRRMYTGRSPIPHGRAPKRAGIVRYSGAGVGQRGRPESVAGFGSACALAGALRLRHRAGSGGGGRLAALDRGAARAARGASAARGHIGRGRDRGAGGGSTAIATACRTSTRRTSTTRASRSASPRAGSARADALAAARRAGRTARADRRSRARPGSPGAHARLSRPRRRDASRQGTARCAACSRRTRRA